MSKLCSVERYEFPSQIPFIKFLNAEIAFIAGVHSKVGEGSPGNLYMVPHRLVFWAHMLDPNNDGNSVTSCGPLDRG